MTTAMHDPEAVAPSAGADEKPDAEHERWQTMGRRERFAYMLQNITVEPLLGFFIVASVLGSLTTQNLNLQKSCRVNLGMSNETCSALERRDRTGYTVDDEARVQALVTDMAIWQSVIQHTVPSIFVVFIGSWSDRTRRRKPLLLVPIIGELVRVFGLFVCVFYFYELPMEIAGLVESVPSSLAGGWTIMFLATFTYMSDITTIKMRTLRIGVLNLSVTIGLSFGIALSGILYKLLGFYGIFTICSSLYWMGLLYGYFFIKDRSIDGSIVVRHNNKLHSNDATLWKNVSDFFSLKHIKNAFATTFKKGNDNRRLRIIMMMIVLMVIMGPMTGEMSVMYMSTRIRFNWDEVNYSIFSTFNMITGFIGTTISLWVFSHKLQMDDALIAAMACVSKVVGSFVFAFAPNEFVFYLGPIVEFIHGAGNIATRSIFTKLVSPNELGQVSAVIGVCEAFVPMIYAPMYSKFYKATMKTFPGAYYLLGGGFTVPAIFIFLWMYKGNKEREARKMEENKNNETAQNNPDLIKIPKTYEVTERNGFENLGFQNEDFTKIN